MRNRLVMVLLLLMVVPNIRAITSQCQECYGYVCLKLHPIRLSVMNRERVAHNWRLIADSFLLFQLRQLHRRSLCRRTPAGQSTQDAMDDASRRYHAPIPVRRDVEPEHDAVLEPELRMLEHAGERNAQFGGPAGKSGTEIRVRREIPNPGTDAKSRDRPERKQFGIRMAYREHRRLFHRP